MTHSPFGIRHYVDGVPRELNVALVTTAVASPAKTVQIKSKLNQQLI